MSNSLLTQLEKLRTTALADIATTATTEDLRTRYLGRKGELTGILRQLSQLPSDERTRVGSAANQLRDELEQALSGRGTLQTTGHHVDMSVPGLPSTLGSIHPISSMIAEMSAIFAELSFEIVEGNELITDEENFETLNITKDHPARDSHDSFYVTDSLLLRTHTTAVQVLEMHKRQKQGRLPIRLVVPGKTYRRESDQTHSPMFHQFDAVVVDTQTTFAELRGTLDYFAKRLFGDTVTTRFRPHHFPFTEPSAELDIKLVNPGSSTGKHTEWLEMGGCGMIHPKVLERAGINPKVYQGWAFGMSVERPLMLRHQIPDLRLLYSSNVHFLSQFTNLS